MSRGFFASSTVIIAQTIKVINGEQWIAFLGLLKVDVFYLGDMGYLFKCELGHFICKPLSIQMNHQELLNNASTLSAKPRKPE